jgi:hypothetical protein
MRRQLEELYGQENKSAKRSVKVKIHRPHSKQSSSPYKRNIEVQTTNGMEIRFAER